MEGVLFSLIKWATLPSVFLTKRFYSFLWMNWNPRFRRSLFFIGSIVIIVAVLIDIVAPILTQPKVWNFFAVPIGFTLDSTWLKDNWHHIMLWAILWVMLLQFLYVFALLTLVAAVRAFLFYGETHANWPRLERAYFENIRKKEKALDVIIGKYEAEKARLSKEWVAQCYSSSEGFLMGSGFDRFTDAVLCELGCRKFQIETDAQGKLSRIEWTHDLEVMHSVEAVALMTATPILHSFQERSIEYNKDNPRPYQYKFTVPFLHFLECATEMQEFSWLYLHPESVRNRIGWAPLPGSAQMAVYENGVKSFREHSEAIIQTHCPKMASGAQFQRIVMLPLVAVLIKTTTTKHTFLGLSKPSMDQLAAPSLTEEERGLKSAEYANSWPYIHSTSGEFFDFFAEVINGFKLTDERHAEAVARLLQFGDSSGMRILFQTAYDEAAHGALQPGSVQYLVSVPRV
jgi:ABC-type multidrug transport system fused ATPase/permease subunit